MTGDVSPVTFFCLDYTQCVRYYISMEKKDMIVELRDKTGMSRKEFAEYFEIPYRTLQDWELGNRRMPEYLFRLMEYKVEAEGLIDSLELGELGE